MITLRNHKKRKRADLFPKKEQHSWKSILGSVVTLVGLQSILYPRKSTQQNERLMMLERNDETVSISVIETTFCIHNGKHSSSMVGMNNGKQSKNQKSSSSQMWDSAFSHSGNGCICVWLCTILINEVNMVMISSVVSYPYPHCTFSGHALMDVTWAKENWVGEWRLFTLRILKQKISQWMHNQ